MSCPVVSCTGGKVKGSVIKLKCQDAKPVYCFRNTPFGKPPVGSLRFMPPQPAEKWEGTRDGTVMGTLPMQSLDFVSVVESYMPRKPRPGKVGVSEDCLHVTVYTPATDKGTKLPVMVWIYGGGFQMGSESEECGSALAGMNEVVVVIPNHRVGIFGYFSMGPNSPCPGNAGLMDQNLALKWIRDNINAFGGDGNNVTIFGESAGGISVNHHVISPMSRGLFHKAISESGQSTMPDHFMFDATERNKALFDYLKIKDNFDSDGDKMLKALQEIPAETILEASMALGEKQLHYFPTVDGKFLTKTPWQALDAREFTNIPYIMGCNNTEGQGMIGVMAAPDFGKGLTEEQAKAAIYRPVTDEYFEAWKSFYIHDEKDDKRFSKLLGYVASDPWFVVPAVRTASAYASKGCDVYLYQGAFRLRMSHEEEYGPKVVKKPEWCICDHGNDICMFMGTPFTLGELVGGAKFSTEEEMLSIKCMTYITNFARNGDPNVGVKVDAQWPKYKPGGEHIVLNTQITTGANLGAKAIEFWTTTMAELEKKEKSKQF